MFMLQCEAVLEADPAEVWKVWTDVAGWPRWDPSKEIARLDGPFAPGTEGWAKQRGNLGGPFTIVAVQPGQHWISECPVPLGKAVFDHVIEPLPGGRVRVAKSVDVRGGFAALFRLVVAPRMRRDIDAAFVSLQKILRDDRGN